MVDNNCFVIAVMIYEIICTQKIVQQWYVIT